MSYPSVDVIQKALMDKVFHYATDRKKAAGRALGTLVEIITYYSLKSWGFRENVAIERPLAEYGEPTLTHNVEFSLHPILRESKVPLQVYSLPITSAKLRAALDARGFDHEDLEVKAAQILSKHGVIRNACTFGESKTAFCIACIDAIDGEQLALTTAVLAKHPFAMFECKRVGVEEGMKKGPQSIEKAKQGAYVARSISALQKIRYHDGTLGGIIHGPRGLYSKPYVELLEEVIASEDPALLKNFILSVGVVSNHGNWFSGKDQNKELRVLANSYDWLLFLTDDGLVEFVSELLLDPERELEAARDAFLSSYGAEKEINRFTKVQMDVKADLVLTEFFTQNRTRVDAWFNVIAPERRPISKLRSELEILHRKPWKKILEL